MFTIFDFFELAALVVGAILGMRYGISWYGITGGIVGFFAGALAALAIGRLPLVIALLFMRRSLTKTSNETLRKRLQTQYYMSHLLLAHLMERGEDVTTEIPLFLDWMHSEMSDKRKFGWAALQLVSPEMAEKIREFDFNDTTEKCRELVARITPEETL